MLREGLATTTQVAGSAATDESSVYDKMTRDINTLLSLTVSCFTVISILQIKFLAF